MKENYKPIGDYIKEVKVRNSELKAQKLLGINIDKFFMPSVANVVGTDMSVYKIVKKNQFACNRMHVGRDYRLPVALSKSDSDFMVSPAYDVFEIKDSKELLPEYLMMWFTRREFDRNAWFYTDADVRGGLHWKALCDMQLPIPHPDKQREIVKEYNVIQNRIKLNEQLIKKLEETAQAIYKQWFVDGIDVKNLPEGWMIKSVYQTANFINGAAFKESDFEITKTGLPIIKIAELKKGVDDQTDFTTKQLVSKYKITNGDMLYSWSGNPETSLEVFKWFGGEAWLNQHIFKLDFEEQHNKIFVYYMLKELKREFVRLAEGKQTTGLGHITIADLKELNVPYPSQKDLKRFENYLRPFYEYDSIIITENQKLIEMKELLLSRLAKVE